MTPDHAAALKVLDAKRGYPKEMAHRQCVRAIPQFAALYRAGVELRAAELARDDDESDAADQRYYSALIEYDAALAAVADALTQGEGK